MTFFSSALQVFLRGGAHQHSRLAATYAQNRPVPLKVRLSTSLPRDLDDFSTLCAKHNVLELYLWLSFRFPKYFIERDMCLQQKNFALQQIEATLMSTTMSQTYSFSTEYSKLRDKLSKSGADKYPPVEYGDVRTTAIGFIDALNPETSFVPPPGYKRDEEEASSGRNSHFNRHTTSNRKFDRKGGFVAGRDGHRTAKTVGAVGVRRVKDEEVMPTIDRLTATD